MRPTLWHLSAATVLTTALISVTAFATSCNGGSADGDSGYLFDTGAPGSSDSSTNCVDGLCIEVYDALYTIQECDGAPGEVCTYANVFFVLQDGGSNVRDLDLDDLEMTINDREVGVEGAEALTQENGMLVDLLLDRSFSITESGATDPVRTAAYSFVENLPDDAFVSIAMFASEEEVPLLLQVGEAPSADSGSFYRVDAYLHELQGLIFHTYEPYETATSASFTKLYDAVGRLSTFAPSNPTLQLLPSVMIVFTDGTDTASTNWRDAAALRRDLDDYRPDQKIYAVGLGDDIDRDALNTLSQGRAYLANSGQDLEAVFEQVNEDLSAIYQYRILVAETEPGASAKMVITYGGTTLAVQQTMYEVDATDGGSGGGSDGSSGDGTDGTDGGEDSGWR